MTATLRGFARSHGPAGARDFVLVLPSVVCAGLVAERLESEFSVAITHQHGCLQVGDDLAHSGEILAGLGANPNVAATVVVGLGCETLQGRELAAAIAARGGEARYVGIQASGGTAAAAAAGRTIVEDLFAEHGCGPRVRVPRGELLLGLDGGEDDLADVIEAEAAGRSISVVRAERSRGSAVHSELAAAGAQVIVSIVAEDQAPVGSPLCPVICVGVGGELHGALAPDFDLLGGVGGPTGIAVAAIDRVEAVFGGAACRAEERGSREFALRRMTMTM